MSPVVGWGLAVLAVAVGYATWGWRGVVLAVTVVVFWLLLQFSRALRVMRNAARSPVGRVPSAVAMQARLRLGMRLMDVIGLTRSLGEKAGETPEAFVWRDDAGDAVRVEFEHGRCTRWELTRAADKANDPAEAGS